MCPPNGDVTVSAIYKCHWGRAADGRGAPSIAQRRAAPTCKCSLPPGPAAPSPAASTATITQVRRSLVTGAHRVELTGFSDGAVSQLKALGLVSEIIAWRLRLFVPTAEERGPAVPGAILDRRPLLGAKATVEQRLVGRDDLQGAGVAVFEIARNRGDQGRASRPSFLAGGNKGSIDPIPHRWHRLHSADHRGDTAAEWFLSTSCAPVQFGNQMDTQAVETTQFILGVLLGSLRRRW